MRFEYTVPSSNGLVLTPLGDRLVGVLSAHFAHVNYSMRPGLRMAAEGFVQALDVLRATQQWTAVAALADRYQLSEEELTKAEYAARSLENRR